MAGKERQARVGGGGNVAATLAGTRGCMEVAPEPIRSDRVGLRGRATRPVGRATRMAGQIERLIYCSRARIPMESLLAIADILAVSQRNNRRDHVTGALGYARGRFVQVLEGAAGDLDRVLRRVETDPRHTDIHVAWRAPVEGRIFAEWTMTAPRIAPEQEPALIEAIENCDDRPATAIEALRRIAAAGS